MHLPLELFENLVSEPPRFGAVGQPLGQISECLTANRRHDPFGGSGDRTIHGGGEERVHVLDLSRLPGNGLGVPTELGQPEIVGQEVRYRLSFDLGRWQVFQPACARYQVRPLRVASQFRMIVDYVITRIKCKNDKIWLICSNPNAEEYQFLGGPVAAYAEVQDLVRCRAADRWLRVQHSLQPLSERRIQGNVHCLHIGITEHCDPVESLGLGQRSLDVAEASRVDLYPGVALTRLSTAKAGPQCLPEQRVALVEAGVREPGNAQDALRADDSHSEPGSCQEGGIAGHDPPRHL